MAGSLHQTIDEIVRIASMTLRNRDIQISLDVRQIRTNYPVLSFDKRRTQQVLNNLLTNAIKFTRQGNIFIEARVRAKEDAGGSLFLEVSVEDEGIGMSVEEVARVFDGPN